MIVKKFSVRQFTEYMNWTNDESVRQMCRGWIDKRTGKKSELPHGYRAQKEGSNWYIYKTNKAIVSETVEMASKESPEDEPDLSEWLDASEEELEDLEAKATEALHAIWWAQVIHTLNRNRTSNIPPLGDPIANSWQEILSPPDKTQLIVRKKPTALKPGLLDALSMCYRFAVLHNKSVEVGLTFTGSGGWKLQPIAPKNEPAFLDICFQGWKNNSILRYLVHALRKKAQGKQLHGEGHCLACGSQHLGKRSQTKFCKFHAHYPDWIKENRTSLKQGEGIATKLGLLKPVESE